MNRCDMELCPNWTGDGNVCPCALFDLEPDPTRTCPRCGTSWTAELDACPHCQDAHPALGTPRPGCGHTSGIHDEYCDQTWYEPEETR